MKHGKGRKEAVVSKEKVNTNHHENVHFHDHRNNCKLGVFCNLYEFGSSAFGLFSFSSRISVSEYELHGAAG